MPFLPNIPQPTDLLSVSQGNILNNFGILGAIAGNSNANSASLNPSSGFNYVFSANNGTTPTFSATNSFLFTQTYPTTGRGELFVLNDSSPSNAGVPMTAAFYLQNGFAFLPSGIIMQWGNATAAGGTATVTFPKAFTTSAFMAQVTPVDATGASIANVTSISTTQLVFANPSNKKCYWFAIGY